MYVTLPLACKTVYLSLDFYMMSLFDQLVIQFLQNHRPGVLLDPKIFHFEAILYSTYYVTYLSQLEHEITTYRAFQSTSDNHNSQQTHHSVIVALSYGGLFFLKCSISKVAKEINTEVIRDAVNQDLKYRLWKIYREVEKNIYLKIYCYRKKNIENLFNIEFFYKKNKNNIK